MSLTDDIRAGAARSRSAPPASASTRTRSRRTRPRCRPSRRPRRTSRAPTTRPAPRSASSSTRSTSAPGWFPTLRKPPGLSGFRTVEAGLRTPRPVDGDELRDAHAERDRGDARPGPRARADGPLRAPSARARDQGRLVPGLRPLRHRRGAGDGTRELGHLVRHLAVRRRPRSRSSSAPRSPPPTSRSPGWPTRPASTA